MRTGGKGLSQDRKDEHGQDSVYHHLPIETAHQGWFPGGSCVVPAWFLRGSLATAPGTSQGGRQQKAPPAGTGHGHDGATATTGSQPRQSHGLGPLHAEIRTAPGDLSGWEGKGGTSS